MGCWRGPWRGSVTGVAATKAVYRRGCKVPAVIGTRSTGLERVSRGAVRAPVVPAVGGSGVEVVAVVPRQRCQTLILTPMPITPFAATIAFVSRVGRSRVGGVAGGRRGRSAALSVCGRRRF